MSNAWLSLGSNLGKPIKQVKTAIEELATHPLMAVVKRSSLYQTKALGKTNQPDFINAVVQIKTSLNPAALLKACQAMENNHRRQRLEHWGPRTLDIDILLFDQQIIHTSSLIVPHSYLHKRAFVLVPLAEISADLLVPNHNQKVSDLLENCGVKGVIKLKL